MKASIFQSCSLALVLALLPMFAGCDEERANSAPVNDPATATIDNQTPPDASADDSATNADANLENAGGKLISTPAATATNISNNPQLTDFVKLVQAGVGESVLLAYVTNSPSAFNVSSDDILYLNDLGTPESAV